VQLTSEILIVLAESRVIIPPGQPSAIAALDAPNIKQAAAVPKSSFWNFILSLLV